MLIEFVLQIELFAAHVTALDRMRLAVVLPFLQVLRHDAALLTGVARERHAVSGVLMRVQLRYETELLAALTALLQLKEKVILIKRSAAIVHHMRFYHSYVTRLFY